MYYMWKSFKRSKQFQCNACENSFKKKKKFFLQLANLVCHDFLLIQTNGYINPNEKSNKYKSSLQS